MNVIGVDVRTEPGGRHGERWRLYPIGDLHLDKRTCDEDRLRRYIERVAADPHALWVLVGDLVDGTTPDHKFFDPSGIKKGDLENMSDYVDHMVERLVKILQPLQAVPGVVIEGNHDIRHGINWSGLARTVARRLGVPYGGGECLIRVRAETHGSTTQGGRMWVIHAQHGAGGGIKPGGKINRFVDTATLIADADIFVRGHVHDAHARVVWRYGVNRKGATPRMTRRSVAYITAGAFTTSRVEGVVDYAGRKSLPPTDEGLLYLEVRNPTPHVGGSGDHNGRIVRVELPF